MPFGFHVGAPRRGVAARRQMRLDALDPSLGQPQMLGDHVRGRVERPEVASLQDVGRVRMQALAIARQERVVHGLADHHVSELRTIAGIRDPREQSMPDEQREGVVDLGAPLVGHHLLENARRRTRARGPTPLAR